MRKFKWNGLRSLEFIMFKKGDIHITDEMIKVLQEIEKHLQLERPLLKEWSKLPKRPPFA